MISQEALEHYTKLGTFQFAEVENDYPFHTVRHISRAEDGMLYDIPAGVMFEDGIEDKEDFEVTIYELVEDDEDRGTYYFYVCFDEGGNQFSMSKYVKEGEQDEE